MKLLCVSFPDDDTLKLLVDLEHSDHVDPSKRKKLDDGSKNNRVQQIKKEYNTRKKKVCA